ncbi:hypothetical protein SM033_00275 [Vibrio phage vB_VpaM_sm033]|nr:hypothetical protein SM033_00275 [Vibrio phage vB_VpaM_sm033]
MFRLIKKWVRKFKLWLCGPSVPDKLDAPQVKHPDPVETDVLVVDNQCALDIIMVIKAAGAFITEVKHVGFSKVSRGLRLKLIALHKMLLQIDSVDSVTRRSSTRLHELIDEVIAYAKEETTPIKREEFFRFAEMMKLNIQTILRNRNIPMG